MKTDWSVVLAIVGRVGKTPLYIGNFINEEDRGSVTLYISKQDIKLDIGFSPPPILNSSGLN
jgi:hypothetical protein